MLREEDIQDIHIVPTYAGKRKAWFGFRIGDVRYRFWSIWKKRDGTYFVDPPKRVCVTNNRPNQYVEYVLFTPEDEEVIQRVVLKKWEEMLERIEKAKESEN